jgi:hypothetical protein
MIKSCINCDEAFEGTRKQMFCSDECEKKYSQKANVVKMPKKVVSKPNKKVEAKEPTESIVIEYVPPKKPYGNNFLSNIEVTAADKERLSQLYGKNDRRKNKCGF